jgi:AcrR family transcriptional regulator
MSQTIPATTPPAEGLRERKKRRTRETIQREALRLIAEQGYDATTVEQIAAAADISPSTFFRYFPTKEDVVLNDEYDPVLEAAVLARPPEESPLRALRRGLAEAMRALSADEQAALAARVQLMMTTPALHARLFQEQLAQQGIMARLLAQRLDRPLDDPAVRVAAGALMGVMTVTILAWAADPRASMFSVLDDALAQFEAGLPL